MYALLLAVVSLLFSAVVPSDVAFVPWKIHRVAEGLPSSPLVLYWVPASADDFRHSDLLTSRALASYAAQCVALEVVTSDDAAMVAKLAIDGPLPAAVLVDAWGVVVGRVLGSKGLLRASEVEKMMRDAMRTREESLNADLDAAPKKISAGDRESGVAIYRRVWMQRCLFPRHGREAERAMKKLGVDVVAEK
ncbi:MAG: hypothetical protein QOE68_3850 [Thermoanaerobaculia bacterium]|nr:hypothetical protein [Thermoanaerobaculia bacterium]